MQIQFTCESNPSLKPQLFLLDSKKRCFWNLCNNCELLNEICAYVTVECYCEYINMLQKGIEQIHKSYLQFIINSNYHSQLLFHRRFKHETLARFNPQPKITLHFTS
jgi:hypothetical protein